MKNFLRTHLSKPARIRIITVYKWSKLITRPQVFFAWLKYRKLNKGDATRFPAKASNLFPITGENTPYTLFDRHYVYHTAWATRVVSEIKPSKHIDISSSLYFCGLLSAFIPVDFYDYRPAPLELSNLHTHAGDLMKLPFGDKTVESISCMHTIEHVGLGRYGDPMDPAGDKKAIKDLMRVVRPGGSLLLVMPVGRQRVEFNAHRIYNPEYVKKLVCEELEQNQFELHEYAFIPESNDEGGLRRNVDISEGKDAYYACGCFWFKRKA